MAGLGAAINTGGVTRGKTVAVFGCGGVGDAAIAGSYLAGATTIVAIDIDDRKLEWAKDFGATHTCNSSTTDPVEFIRSVTGGFGADVCIEAIGNLTVYRQAFEARDLAGIVVLVGVPRPTDVHRAAVHRGVRPGRGAEVELVRRLPAVARLPDAHRPLPPGSARPRPVRQRGDRPRRRRGGLPQDGARRGAALRRRASVRDRRARHHATASSPSTAASGRSPTTSGSSATTARSSCSTPPTTTSRSSTPSAAAGCGRSC